MAHGYLLSSFLSPLTNVRDDEYGDDRAKFPLEVFAACRAVWPADEADERAHQRDRLGRRRLRRRRRGRVRAAAGRGGLRHRRRLDRAGLARPASPPTGARYQTPYADRIRHEAGIPVIAVGAISSYDDVNTIILAGRADLCALARPHLWDPHWTLHAAADQGVDDATGSRSTGPARASRNTGKDVRRMPLRRFEPRCPREDGRRHGRQARDRRRDHRGVRRRARDPALQRRPRRDRRGRGRARVRRARAVDVLVNNAGVSSSAPVKRTTLDEWERQLARQRHRRVPVHARGRSRGCGSAAAGGS